MSRPTTYRDAESYLLDRELFGMRFGLDRMRRLLTALGSPQERFATIHVVGSNGKSSTTRFTAAILERHGLRAGSYTSPHLIAFTERVEVGGRSVAPADFAAAVNRVATAVEKVERTLAHDDRVTQFEALTAAAFVLLADAEVDVAVIEAGLGGRHDATNVIASAVQVLSTVALEHTRWLGPTIAAVAGEKLDVVRPGGTLVVGPDLHPDALLIAREVCERRGALLVTAPGAAAKSMAATGGFQQCNFALARTAAQGFLGTIDEHAVAQAAASTTIPGRFEVLAGNPVTVLDGAHNGEAAAALAAALRDFSTGRPIVAVIAILDDKDADAIISSLAPLCRELVLTRCSHPRSLAPVALGLAAERAGAAFRIEPDPRVALDRARALAAGGGIALATGSLYLLADLRTPAVVARRSVL